MSTRIQLITETVTITVKNRNVKGVRYTADDGKYNIDLVSMKSGALRRICGTCDGVGYRDGYQYVMNGICFYCNGSGLQGSYADDKTAEKYVRMAVGRMRANERKAIEARAKDEAIRVQRDAEWTAWAPNHADIIEFVQGAFENDNNRFLDDMHLNLRNKTPLTEKQVEAVRKIQAAQDAQRFVGSEKEKLTVTGVIAKTFSGYSDFGTYYAVIIDGTGEFQGATFKLMGSSKVLVELQDADGDAVTIQATVKKHSVYQGVKQTEMIRPKLIEQVPVVNAETEEALTSGEPKWAGELHVNLVHQDTYVVYAVNGTKHAYDLLTELNAVHGDYNNVSSAYLSFYGSEWNRMHFIPTNLSRYGSSDGKLVSLLDRDNVHYAVTDYKDKCKLGRLTLAQEHVLDDWRKAYGELQLHVQARGHGTHHACQISGVQRWGCPEWREMNKPVEELENQMRELDMAAPYAVLERPAR